MADIERDLIHIYVPQCPDCERTVHQKSNIIMYNEEVRHSITCLICGSEYRIQYDKRNRENEQETFYECGSEEDCEQKG